MSIEAGSPLSASHAKAANWLLQGRERVPTAVIKDLQKRRDFPGLIYFIVHWLTIAASAWLVYLSLGTAWVWPAMVVYGSISVMLFAPMHECWHWTAFRTRWLNDAVGCICAFFIWRPFFWARYLHTAHHTYTQLEGHDTDVVKVPNSLAGYVYYMSGIGFWKGSLGWYWRGLSGRWNAFDRTFLPEVEFGRASIEIRIQIAILVALLMVSWWFESSAILWFWLLPRLLGEPMMRLLRMAEHAGAELSPNLLASVRTTYTNPFIRFYYWQMPYHAEHHLYPSVPFHRLAELNKLTAPHLQCVGLGYFAVHREIIRSAIRNGRSETVVKGSTHGMSG